MSDNSNNNQQQDDTQKSQIQEGQGQEATKEVVSNPEPDKKLEPQTPEPTKPPKKEDNLKYFKEKWQTEAKEKEDLAKRMAEIEKNLEAEKLERVKQTAINQALELGLNPEKRKVFEKYHLSHLTSAEDVNQALTDFKDEMPEFFSKPKVNLTNSPSGGGGQTKDVKNMDTEEFLNFSNN